MAVANGVNKKWWYDGCNEKISTKNSKTRIWDEASDAGLESGWHFWLSRGICARESRWNAYK